MSEFFTRPPDIPDEELNRPRVIPPETAFARTIATVLMMVWAYWWWNGRDDGAYWVIAAVVIFATGETMSHLYRPLLPLWWPLSYIVRPTVFVFLKIVRTLIPEAYRRPQKVLRPLSLNQINTALDEAAAARETFPGNDREDAEPTGAKRDLGPSDR